MSSKLLHHVLFFRYKNVSVQDMKNISEAFMDLKNKIPTVHSIAFGSSEDKLYDGYKIRDKGFTHAGSVIFKNSEDLKEYNVHEAHVTFVEKFVKPHLIPADDIMCIDFYSPIETKKTFFQIIKPYLHGIIGGFIAAHIYTKRHYFQRN